MADDGHVDGAVALAVAFEAVMEDCIEGPVQAVLDGPVGAHGVACVLRAEAARGDVIAGVGAAVILEMGAGLDADDALGFRQAELAGKVALAFEPMGLGRDGDGALFDVALVRRMVAGHPVKRCIGEIVFDLLADGGLVGLDREEVIGPAAEDGIGDDGVGGNGVDGKPARP